MARLYTLITVVTPAKPTCRPGDRAFDSQLPGPFAAVRATGSHLPRLSEALATGTRPVRSRLGMQLCRRVYARLHAASIVDPARSSSECWFRDTRDVM